MTDSSLFNDEKPTYICLTDDLVNEILPEHPGFNGSPKMHSVSQT